MKATIDKAGRVVIPAALRARAGLCAGTVLTVAFEDNEVRLTPDRPHARLVRRRGRLIARAAVPSAGVPDVDVAALVNEERDRWPV